MLKIVEYTIGWICAIDTELTDARLFLDEEHDSVDYKTRAGDDNLYIFGTVSKHNVVIATLPDGEYGTTSAATVTTNLIRSFPHIKAGLVVDVAVGVPLTGQGNVSNVLESTKEVQGQQSADIQNMKVDIRLGDIVVGYPMHGKGGVYHYRYGKSTQRQEFQQTGHRNAPPKSLLTAVAIVKSDLKLVKKSIESIHGMVDAALADSDPDILKEFGQPRTLQIAYTSWKQSGWNPPKTRLSLQCSIWVNVWTA